MSREVPDHALKRLLSDSEPLLDEVGRAPERVGKYRVVRLIGRGGMGVVYEAFDEELERPVALKLLDAAAAANASLRERLLREARAAARLGHPNIAAVYDAGEGWIAMRLVAGPPLHVAPPADVATHVRRIRDAALAVQHAHEAGIVHRDLKPHNLLLEGERIFVTDFGLAKELAVDSSLSLSGHVVGTPSYMAPEQAQGRVHAVDARTDVFGLGATLYHLLAGRPPFVDEDVVQVLRRIVEEEPPPLSLLAPEVPRDLETIVLKCLEKDPDRRYASALALAEDLDRWLRGEPVIAKRPSLAYRVGKFARRHRALVSLSAGSALALAIVGAAAWNERASNNASTSALALAAHVLNVLEDHERFQQVGRIEQALLRLDAGIAACDAFLERHDVAHAHWLRGMLLRRSGDVVEAKAALDRSLELDPGLVEARLERGLLVGFAFVSARRQLEPTKSPLPPELAAMRSSAIADLEAAVREPNLLSEIGASLARAEIHILKGELVKARPELDELEQIAPTNLDMLHVRSQLELEEGNIAAARKHAMSIADVMRGLGPAYVAQQEAADQAVRLETLRVEEIEGALVDFETALSADPSTAIAYANSAFVRARLAARLSGEGKLEDALKTWEKAIADATSAITIDPLLSGAWNNRALCRTEREQLLAQLGRADDAAEERRAAGEDFDEALRLDPRSGPARLNRASHRRREAEEAAERQDWSQVEASVVLAGEDANEALRLRAHDAIAWLERAMIGDLEARMFAAQGDASAASHARDLARADYDVAVGLDPGNGRALALRGLHRASANDAIGARADLEAALAGALDRDLRGRVSAELARLPR